jgi:hypothetical protein
VQIHGLTRCVHDLSWPDRRAGSEARAGPEVALPPKPGAVAGLLTTGLDY